MEIKSGRAGSETMSSTDLGLINSLQELRLQLLRLVAQVLVSLLLEGNEGVVEYLHTQQHPRQMESPVLSQPAN